MPAVGRLSLFLFECMSLNRMQSIEWNRRLAMHARMRPLFGVDALGQVELNQEDATLCQGKTR